MKYSKELIDRCIKYFAEENGHRIDQETAEEYLENLGGLFLAFADVKKDN